LTLLFYSRDKNGGRRFFSQIPWDIPHRIPWSVKLVTSLPCISTSWQSTCCSETWYAICNWLPHDQTLHALISCPVSEMHPMD
jgi:hypothetical protein